MAAQISHSIEDLLAVMARLRDPQGGCPWDLQQNFQSIVSSTLEECYELIDAIEREDYVHLEEELGDLLFQVVFYGQLGKEEGLFDFQSIASKLTEKLLRRHPHVFPSGCYDPHQPALKPTHKSNDILNEEDVKQQWEDIKAQERQAKTLDALLDDIPLALPAMSRALKLQKRVAKVGFDWPSISGVIDKLKEEIAELEQAISIGERDHIAAELGDLMFCCVNLARHLKVEPETSLRATNHKFEQRFRFIEKQLQNQNLSPESASLAQMDELWDEAKKQGL